MSGNRITREERLLLDDACGEFGIELLVLFGSGARGDLRDESDIDLAYAREEPLSLGERAEFAGEIGRILGERDRPVDLVDLRRADPLHLKKISEDSQLLAGTRERFEEFRRRAFHRYSDYKPYLQREKETTSRRIRELM